MKVNISSRFPITPELLWQELLQSKSLLYVAHPVVKFQPKQGAFPAQWTPGVYSAKMLLYGLIPIGSQDIVISFPVENQFVLRDNGRGELVKVWDHWITVLPHPDDNWQTLYTDEVTVKAGLLTPFIYVFAALFYLWRQYLWRGWINQQSNK